MDSSSPQSTSDWMSLAHQHKGDAFALLKSKRNSGCWMSAGFSVECVLKAAIMKKEGWNRWPDDRPDLHTHDLKHLLSVLGIELSHLKRDPVSPSLKTLLDWKRHHGYRVKPMPDKYAKAIVEAAFGADGVVEWITTKYQIRW